MLDIKTLIKINVKTSFLFETNDKISLPKVQHVKLPCTLKTPSNQRIGSVV